MTKTLNIVVDEFGEIPEWMDVARALPDYLVADLNYVSSRDGDERYAVYKLAGVAADPTQLTG